MREELCPFRINLPIQIFHRGGVSRPMFSRDDMMLVHLNSIERERKHGREACRIRLVSEARIAMGR